METKIKIQHCFYKYGAMRKAGETAVCTRTVLYKNGIAVLTRSLVVWHMQSGFFTKVDFYRN